MRARAESIEDAELVSCKWCGVVFELKKVGEFVSCPVCDRTDDKEPVPKLGRVNVWWERV